MGAGKGVDNRIGRKDINTQSKSCVDFILCMSEDVLGHCHQGKQTCYAKDLATTTLVNGPTRRPNDL